MQFPNGKMDQKDWLQNCPSSCASLHQLNMDRNFNRIYVYKSWNTYRTPQVVYSLRRFGMRPWGVPRSSLDKSAFVSGNWVRGPGESNWLSRFHPLRRSDCKHSTASDPVKPLDATRFGRVGSSPTPDMRWRIRVPRSKDDLASLFWHLEVGLKRIKESWSGCVFLRIRGEGYLGAK